MKRIIAALAFLIAFATTPAVQAKLISLEEAVESMNAELLLNGPGQGFVLVHDCYNCKQTKFVIDAKTYAIKGKKMIPLEEARGLMRKGVTVIFDAKTKVVTRLLFM